MVPLDPVVIPGSVDAGRAGTGPIGVAGIIQDHARGTDAHAIAVIDQRLAGADRPVSADREPVASVVGCQQLFHAAIERSTRVQAIAAPATQDAIVNHNILFTGGDSNAVQRTGRAHQRKSFQVQGHIVGRNRDAALTGDPGKIGRDVIGTGASDIERQAGDGRAWLNLRETLHGRPGWAGRSKGALSPDPRSTSQQRDDDSHREATRPPFHNVCEVRLVFFGD